jgi:hypothetical protein
VRPVVLRLARRQKASRLVVIEPIKASRPTQLS